MSLNFDLTACKTRLGDAEYERITTDPFRPGKWHPVSNALIWMTMAVGIGKIDETTIDEFCYRMRILQKIDGAELQYNDDTVIEITRKDVENHIGLRTNVFPMETRAKWIGRVFNDPYNKFGKFKPATGEGNTSAHDQIAERFDKAQAEKQEA